MVEVSCDEAYISASAYLQILAKHLSQHELDICLAYSFMVQARLTNKESQKLPRAFRGSNLVSPDHIQARVRLLAGVEPELYDCCPGPNACMCFTGEHRDLKNCLICNAPRFNSKGHPRRRFTYIPIVPRLQAAAASRSLAEAMQYRGQYKHEAGMIGDVFDGKDYQHLQNSDITLDGEVLKDSNGKALGTKYFEDPRDVALGLSTDGFSVHGSTFWPLIIFLYNLPPTIRFLLENIFALGIIPGKPVLTDTFLWPFLQELRKLASGVTAYDILSCKNFILRAFLILIFGDIPAIAMLMHMKGHNGISPCCICPIIATPLRRGTQVTYYVVSTFDDDAEWRTLRDHQTMMRQAQEIEDAPTKGQAEALAKTYGIKGKSTLSSIGSIQFPPHSHMTSCTLSGKVLSRLSFSCGLGTSKALMRAKRSIRLTLSIGNRLELKLLHLQKLFLLHLAHIFQTLLTASPISVPTCGLSGFSSLALLSSRIASSVQSTSSTLSNLFPSSTPVFSGEFPKRRLISSRKDLRIG